MSFDTKKLKNILEKGKDLFAELKQSFIKKSEKAEGKSGNSSKRKYAILALKIIFLPITIMVFVFKKIWSSNRLNKAGKIAITVFISICLLASLGSNSSNNKNIKNNNKEVVVDYKEDTNKKEENQDKKLEEKVQVKEEVKPEVKVEPKAEVKNEVKQEVQTQEKNTSVPVTSTQNNNQESVSKNVEQPKQPAVTNNNESDGSYIIPMDGKKYHLDGCPSHPIVKQRVSKAKAESMGYGSCKRCHS